MKRLALLCLILSSLTATSQGDSIKKPIKKNISAEVTFSPFSANPINLPYLRIRGFLNQRHAVRLGIIVSGRKDSQDPNTQVNTFTYNLRPGYEFHFKGTRHLSPYAGVEFDYAMRRSKYNEGNPNPLRVTGASSSSGDEQSFTRLGAGLTAGVDIYLIKKLYMGLELGYGFSQTKFRDIEITQTNGTTIYTGYKTAGYGATINRTIRLGFFF
jgi:hypothetical protein